MKVNRYLKFSLIGFVIKFEYSTNIYAKAGVKIRIEIQCFCNDQLKSKSPGKKNSKPNGIPKAYDFK